MVTIDAGDDSGNPYAPPIAAPALPKPHDDASQRNLNIEFRGRPTQRELKACLSAEQRGSVLGFVGLLLFFMPLLQIAANASSPSFFLICVGVCGWVIVLYTVSGVRYRAGLFTNEFPQWDAMDGGRIDENGITLVEGDSWFLYRWGWFSHACAANNAILFVPALQSKCPLLIGKNMLVPGRPENVVVDWKSFCNASVELLHRSQNGFYKKRLKVDSAQRRLNVELICNRERLRTVSLDSGAIPFSGDVTTRDLERISIDAVALRRTLRSRMVIGLLLIFGGLIASGISALLLDAFWVLLFFYCTLILAWNIKARTTQLPATQRRHYFLLGYATDQRILLDLGMVVISFAWPEIKVLTAAGDLIAIKSGRRGQPIVLRADMFQTEEQWRYVFDMAMAHATPAVA